MNMRRSRNDSEVEGSSISLFNDDDRKYGGYRDFGPDGPMP